MKRLYLIGGTMGVGKTAVSRQLLKILPHCVFLDGDWCWKAEPFQITEETKQMVLENIRFLLNQFLHCSTYENIVFCWVMHEQNIIEQILSGLNLADCEVVKVSLVCSEGVLRERLQKDVTCGIRHPDVIERSIQRIPLYGQLETVKIDTDGKNVDTIAEEIAGMCVEPGKGLA